MSDRSILISSIVLAVPAQYLFLLTLQLYEFWTVGISNPGGSGAYGCYDFHQDGLSECSFGAMLYNPIAGIILTNILSFGFATLLSIGVIALLLLIGRAAYRRRSASG